MEQVIFMKYLIGIGILCFILFVGFYVFRIGVASHGNEEATTSSIGVRNDSSVQIGDIVIPVEIAKGAHAVQKGLSGRLSLGADSGMFFIFKKPGIYRFWMPDMHFPIDIIWIAEQKIVGIEHNVSHIFDPLRPLFYSPSEPVQYVLEVNAGFSEMHGIQVGDQVVFNNISLYGD